jgi:succinate dehydrogenase / fumarate reductase iron-sulfur subunit
MAERTGVYHPRGGSQAAHRVAPAAGLPVIRDLIVDMSQFFKQYHSIKPYVVNNDPPPEKERLQSPEERAELDGL